MSTKGHNAWVELMTSDPDAAKGFYGSVTGWTTAPFGEADAKAPYFMFMQDEVPSAGLMQLPPEAAAMGAPPHWLAYTTVENVDAAVGKAKGLGAAVHAAPFDVPKVGRIAVLADPQGATFAVYTPLEDMPPVTPAPGFFGWAELNTSDWKAAWSFYSERFGWVEHSQMDMGDGEIYFMFTNPEKTTQGGMGNDAAKMGVPPHWLHYVSVENIEAACEAVRANGGKVLNGPMAVPGGGQIAQCSDPQGAAFAVYQDS